MSFWEDRIAKALQGTYCHSLGMYGMRREKELADVRTQAPNRGGMEGLDVDGGDCSNSCGVAGGIGCWQPRVLVLGDGMTDHYWIGTADRVSPEAPIPVVKIERSLAFAGGAGNVAKNLITLGAKADFIGGDRGLSTKNRLMVGDVQVARWDQDDWDCEIDWSRVPKSNFDAVAVADYGKGSITTKVVEAVQRFKRERSVDVFIDTKGDPTPWLPIAKVMFPNTKEYMQYRSQYDRFEWVVLKQGAKGVSLVQRGMEILHLPSFAGFVRSVNGAGDSTMAGFVRNYLFMKNTVRGLSLLEQGIMRASMRYANATAAVVVEKPYTATATHEEVLAVLRRIEYEGCQKVLGV